MKRILFVAASILMSAPAFAQNAPASASASAFVPYQVDEQSFNGLMSYLNAQPYGVAAPVINWLQTEERSAQQAAKTAAAGPDPAAAAVAQEKAAIQSQAAAAAAKAGQPPTAPADPATK